MDSNPIATVQAFAAAINSHDVSQIAALMSDDHIFIDSGGKVDADREHVIVGWGKYLRMFPDYKIGIEDILQGGNIVAAFGSAAGTYNGKRGLVPENLIEMPAAWKAVVENGKIKLWRVYADWSEGTKIIELDRNE